MNVTPDKQGQIARDTIQTEALFVGEDIPRGPPLSLVTYFTVTREVVTGDLTGFYRALTSSAHLVYGKNKC